MRKLTPMMYDSTPALPRLHLSLAAPGFGLLRVAQWALLLVTAGSVAVTAWLWAESITLEQRASDYDRSAVRAQELTRQFVQQAAQAGFDLTEERIKALAKEASYANQLLEKRAFSWTRLLSDLEETVPPAVSLSVVTLGGTDATITLTGTARTLRDLTVFVDALEGHPSFRNAVLAHHRVREAGRRSAGKASARAVGQTGSLLIEFMLTVTYGASG